MDGSSPHRPTHPAALPDAALLAQCRLTRGRGSGPGGQHRHNVRTLVELVHEPSGASAHAGERRSAEENKLVALKRLRLALAMEVRMPVPLGDAASELWRRRIQRAEAGTRALGRIACNPGHADYPALLAEALDMIEACHADVRRAAIRLDCSPSSLMKLVKDHPPAWVLVNRWRAERGEHELR